MQHDIHGRYAYHAVENTHHIQVSKQISVQHADLFYIALGAEHQITDQMTSHYFQILTALDVQYRYGLRKFGSSSFHIDEAVPAFYGFAMPIILHDGYYFAAHFVDSAKQCAAQAYLEIMDDYTVIDQNLLHAQQVRLDRQFKKSWSLCPAQINEFHQSYGYYAVRLYLQTYTSLPSSEFDYDIGYENALKFICRIWQYFGDVALYKHDQALPASQSKYPSAFFQHLNNNRNDLAIAALHSWSNDLIKQAKSGTPIDGHNAYAFLSCLQVICPYLTEEILSHVENSVDVSLCPLPQISAQCAAQEKQVIIFQINAHKQHCLFAPKGLNEKSLQDFVFADPVVQKKMKHIKIRKIITVPERVVNFLTA